MVPEAMLSASVAFDGASGHSEALTGNLSVGEPFFLIPTQPASSFELFGLAQGGSVTATINGTSITVTTFEGQTPEQVAAALAAAINADPTFAALGIVAYVDGARVVVSAEPEISIDDPGLNDVGCPNPPFPLVVAPTVNSCPETAVLLEATTTYATYQWFRDDVQISGARSADFGATLTGGYVVRVQAGDGCVGYSTPQTVSVLFCPESEVSPAGAIFPLRIEKSELSSNGYFLYIQDFEGQGTGSTGFNLYAGTLGQWYSHGESNDNFCSMIDLDVEDLGTGELRYTLQVPIADAYFLITGWEGDVEGVSHRTSEGTPVDDTQNTCAP
jgi:hypothetical protein